LQLATQRVQSPDVRARSFQSGTFVEGWAVYCEQMMAKQLWRPGSKNAATENATARDL
jgi:hypothetical protein